MTSPSTPGSGPAEAIDIEGIISARITRSDIKVPPYPGVAAQLSRLVNGGDYSLKEVARLVTADQALSADALRFANSSAMHSAGEITSVGQAISRIGARQIVQLAFASGLGKKVLEQGPLTELRAMIWRQALTSALFCQNLAAKRKLNAADAFTCGLLHDFGKVIAIACIEEGLKESGNAVTLPMEAWLAAVDRYHVDLGVIVANQWNLSATLREVIALHHKPAEDAADRAMVGLVQTSDAVVDMMEAQRHVTSEELESVPLVAAAEVPFVERLIPKIPPLVASFAGQDQGGAGAKGAGQIAKRETTLVGKRRPLQAQISAFAGETSTPYEGRYMTPEGIGFVGKAAISEGNLLRLAITSARGEATDPPLEVWATVTLCVAEPAGQRVEAKLFGTGAEMKRRWDVLYKAASPEAS